MSPRALCVWEGFEPFRGWIFAGIKTRDFTMWLYSCFCLCFLTALLRSGYAPFKLLQTYVTVVSEALSCMERLHFISSLWLLFEVGRWSHAWIDWWNIPSVQPHPCSIDWWLLTRSRKDIIRVFFFREKGWYMNTWCTKITSGKWTQELITNTRPRKGWDSLQEHY